MLNKIILFLFFIPTVYAQSIVSSRNSIAHRESLNSSVEFITEEKSIFEDTADSNVPVPGYLYSSNLPTGAGEYDGLPSCVSNQVRVNPRSESEDSFMSLDVFVYQFNDSEQKNKAKAFGSKAVPFIEGALANPYRPQGDTEQTIIRTLGIQCLPTRVRSISRDGQKFFEFREGNKSWKSQDSQ